MPGDEPVVKGIAPVARSNSGMMMWEFLVRVYAGHVFVSEIFLRPVETTE